MISEKDILRVPVNKNEMNLVIEMSRAACRGGVSRIRSSQDRQATLYEDQLVGQIGTYAGTKFWFGSSHNYLIARQVANLNPRAGDGGSDIIGANIDFKTSKIRSTRPLLDYRLVVRPRERSAGKVYVQLLVELSEFTAVAHILGWASDDMLPGIEVGGTFDGAHVLPVRELNPLPPLQWLWIETARQAQETMVN